MWAVHVPSSMSIVPHLPSVLHLGSRHCTARLKHGPAARYQDGMPWAMSTWLGECTKSLVSTPTDHLSNEIFMDWPAENMQESCNKMEHTEHTRTNHPFRNDVICQRMSRGHFLSNKKGLASQTSIFAFLHAGLHNLHPSIHWNAGFKPKVLKIHQDS